MLLDGYFRVPWGCVFNYGLELLIFYCIVCPVHLSCGFPGEIFKRSLAGSPLFLGGL